MIFFRLASRNASFLTSVRIAFPGRYETAVAIISVRYEISGMQIMWVWKIEHKRSTLKIIENSLKTFNENISNILSKERERDGIFRNLN